jgi:hypothetical protein
VKNLFLATILTISTFLNFTYANDIYEKPLILIGASYANGKTPFNEGTTAPIFGTAVGNGSYLDLNQAFIRRNEYVVNEAQAGATTFEREGCLISPECGPGKWDSYETQLSRALARVFSPATDQFNAEFVIISLPNDCLHPDAFGIPLAQTTPCNLQDIQDVANRMEAVATTVLSLGMTPVFTKYPRYQDLDLPFAQQTFGFPWIIDEANYNLLRNTLETRLSNIPGAVFVRGAWRGFRPLRDEYGNLVDGLHPDFATVRHAANRILARIKDFN